MNAHGDNNTPLTHAARSERSAAGESVAVQSTGEQPRRQFAPSAAPFEIFKTGDVQTDAVRFAEYLEAELAKRGYTLRGFARLWFWVVSGGRQEIREGSGLSEYKFPLHAKWRSKRGEEK